MQRLIAFCGLNCAECEGYLATQSNDPVARERVAAKWRQEFNSPDITADNILCDGCTTNKRLIGYCSMCEIRACGAGRQVTNCAYCADYATCDKLTKFHAGAPAARANLDEIRRTLAQ